MSRHSLPNASSPKLHLLCGKIASGKSTLAGQLAEAPVTLLISEDRWLASLYGEEMNSVADYVRCSAKLRSAITPHLISLLSTGISVVLDFPANTVSLRKWMRGIAQAASAEPLLHYLNVADSHCKTRLQARNASGSHDFAATEAQFELISRYFEAPCASEGFTLIVHSSEQEGAE
ncbi:AAA family ATPase [Erwinia sp.]|uniref:AAA family ATPase n=1 Tax=Erwinia citreus TaxID=558 RepID=UPI003C73E61F